MLRSDNALGAPMVSWPAEKRKLQDALLLEQWPPEMLANLFSFYWRGPVRRHYSLRFGQVPWGSPVHGFPFTDLLQKDTYSGQIVS